MRTTMRFGIAAAAALAFTPSARPCDPQAYDPKDDAPRAQECPSEQASQARAVLPMQQQHLAEAKVDAASMLIERTPAEIDRTESRNLGSGSGEPAPAAQPDKEADQKADQRQADQRQADQAEELQRIWTSP